MPNRESARSHGYGRSGGRACDHEARQHSSVFESLQRVRHRCRHPAHRAVGDSLELGDELTDESRPSELLPSARAMRSS
jgi:hypothetical protein